MINGTKHCKSLHLVYGTIFVRGKAILSQAWTDAKGSRSLRLLDFKTIGT